MKNSFLLIIVYLCIHESFCQNITVGLSTVNTIYIGIDNKLDIAVEGYRNDQFTISSTGCMVFKDTVSNQLYLKAERHGICKVAVSYVKDAIVKTDTLNFKVTNVPKVEGFFGELESGSFSVSELMNQNRMVAKIPKFHMEGFEYTVNSYAVAFVPNNGEACVYSLTNDKIPLELKRLILASKKGDKILIDEIQVTGPNNRKRRMPPIILIISNDYPEKFEDPILMTHQENCDSAIKVFMEKLYGCNNSYTFKPGILKGYQINGGDTQKMIMKVNKTVDKVLWEKHYYNSGRLKAEYNFEVTDTLGEAITYYENGAIESKGKVIVKSENIFRYCRGNASYVGEGNLLFENNEYYLTRYFSDNYAPYGHWLIYSENGRVIVDCSFQLVDYGVIPINDGDRKFSLYGSSENKPASIKEAINSKDHYYKMDYKGSFKFYDEGGKPSGEELFKTEY